MTTGALGPVFAGCLVLALSVGPVPMARAQVGDRQGKVVVRCATLEVVQTKAVHAKIAALLGAPLRYIILEEARPEDRASAQGLLNVFLAIGQLGGAAIVGSVAASLGGGTVGYQWAYVVLAALSAVLIVSSLGLKSKTTT